MAKTLDLVRLAEWQQYGWLRQAFSSRAGGVSTVYGAAAYGDGALNLGWTREDDPALVRENRARFLKEVNGATPASLVTMRQVHGAEVVAVREVSEGLVGDGMMTGVQGLLLGIQTADCVPVLVVDVRQRVVAAIHAGWRGTVAGIAERGVARMREEYGSRTEDLIAAVGPSIGACCYEVGEEVRGEFERAFKYGSELFEEGMRLDLWEANRRQLAGAGVGRVTVVGECTGCSGRYFSYRKEGGVTGRMMSVVGVVQE